MSKNVKKGYIVILHEQFTQLHSLQKAYTN